MQEFRSNSLNSLRHQKKATNTEGLSKSQGEGLESFGNNPLLLFPKCFSFRHFPYTPGISSLWAQEAQTQFAALPWGYMPPELPPHHHAPSCHGNLLSSCHGWCNSQELLWTSAGLEQDPEQAQDSSSSATVPAPATVLSSLCSRPQRPHCLSHVLNSLHMVPLLPAAVMGLNKLTPGQLISTGPPGFISLSPSSPNHQLQLSWNNFLSHMPWRKLYFLCNS